MAAVTIEDLKKEISAYNYKLLTSEDDSVGVRCLEKATLWAKAKVIACGDSFDPEGEIHREIVIKRALYELYSYAENEAVALDKKEDALELLRAVYGTSVDGTGYGQDTGSSDIQGVPVGSLKKGARNTSLF